MSRSNQQKYMPWIFIALGIGWCVVVMLLGRMGT